MTILYWNEQTLSHSVVPNSLTKRVNTFYFILLFFINEAS